MNHLVIVSGNFAREQNLSTTLIPTFSKEIDEQFKLANKLVDVVNRANKKIHVILVRYKMAISKSLYAQIRTFARKNDDEKFQEIVCLTDKIVEVIFLSELFNSVYHDVVNDKPFGIVLEKVIAIFVSIKFHSIQVRMSSNIVD